MAGEKAARGAGAASAKPRIKPAKNKTKVMMLSTRGVTTRFRHLMEDVQRLVPHSRKVPKLDAKNDLQLTNEIAELHAADTVLLFEARKRQDLYLWLSKPPFGPSIKFLLTNLHTMSELSFPGNNLLHSRALVTFDPSFEGAPHLRLVKELLTHVFAAPHGHRRTKPFVDHVISFVHLDGRIWFRHYQIVDAALNENTLDRSVESTIVEVGPRFVLAPIKIFAGSFSGATIWQNGQFISPNEIRRAERKRVQDQVINRVDQRTKRRKYEHTNRIVHDEITKVFR